MLKQRFGDEARRARITASLSQRELGSMLRVSHAKIGRTERGEGALDVVFASELAASLGMEVSLGLHLVGSPLRDRAHLALLARFSARLHSSIRFRTEVPLPIPGDLRSIDGVLSGAIHAMVEAETRLSDMQAVERRARAKQRDAGIERLILLLSDTRTNRTALAAIPDLDRRFPCSTRRALAALAAGRDPGADGIVVL